MNLYADAANSDNLIKIGFYFGLACLIVFPIIMTIYIYFAKRQDHVPFHLRNCFPYEAFIDKERKQDILGRILEVLVLLSGLIPSIFSLSAFLKTRLDSNFTIYNVFFLILSLISAIAFFLVSILPLTHPRSHLIVYFGYMASLILKKTVGGVTLLQLGARYSEAAKILGIIVLVSLVGEIFFLVNPKLKTWDKMERITNKKGEEVLARPKWFVLAYSEWGAFYLSAVIDIILTVGVFLAKFHI